MKIFGSIQQNLEGLQMINSMRALLYGESIVHKEIVSSCNWRCYPLDYLFSYTNFKYVFGLCYSLEKNWVYARNFQRIEA